VATSCFADRLAKHVALSDAEKKALTRLEENPRKVKRGAMIQRVNEMVTELFVLREGRVMSFVILPDGSRQILRVYFPGDFIGSASTIYSRAPESLVALSDAIICPFDKHALRRLLEEYPRVAALLFLLSNAERVALDGPARLPGTHLCQGAGGILPARHIRPPAGDRRWHH